MNILSSHPSQEDLFEAAQEGDAGALAPHLASCSECRVAFERLSAGSLLLDEGRRAPDLDGIDWSKMDAVLAKEAETVAAGIRAGSIRAPRPVKTYAMVGGLAMAAGVAFWVATSRPSIDAPLADRTPAGQTPGAPKPAVDPRPASAQVDGVVMLAAGGVAQVPHNGTSVSLAEGAPLREGARIATNDSARAVISVAPSVAVDVRASSDVSFATLRERDVTLALAQGEVAIDHEGEGPAVGVQAGRWKVAIEGDALTRVQSNIVRVVVLSGRASVGADGVTTTHFTGPIVLELPEVGAARTVDGAATDPARIDLSLLRVGGALVRLPTIDPAAVITARGHGALPGRLQVLRSIPVTLEARFGRTLMTLDVGMGIDPVWHRAATAVASAQPGAQRTTPTAVVAPTPAQQGRDLTQNERNVVERRAVGLMRHCFTRCQEQNTCPQLRGNVVLSVDAMGSARMASLDPSAAAARACVESEAVRVRFPATGGAFNYDIPVSR